MKLICGPRTHSNVINTQWMFSADHKILYPISKVDPQNLNFTHWADSVVLPLFFPPQKSVFIFSLQMSQGYWRAEKDRAEGGRLSQVEEGGEKTMEKGSEAAAESIPRRTIWQEQEVLSVVKAVRSCLPPKMMRANLRGWWISTSRHTWIEVLLNLVIAGHDKQSTSTQKNRNSVEIPGELI